MDVEVGDVYVRILEMPACKRRRLQEPRERHLENFVDFQRRMRKSGALAQQANDGMQHEVAHRDVQRRQGSDDVNRARRDPYLLPGFTQRRLLERLPLFYRASRERHLSGMLRKSAAADRQRKMRRAVSRIDEKQRGSPA
jgi:hypothetical protein